MTVVPRKNDVITRQNADKFTAKKRVKIQHLPMTSTHLVHYDMFMYAGEFK